MATLSDFYEKFQNTTGSEYSFRMQKLLDVATRFQSPSLLDIGCGDGELTLAFAKKCKAERVVGIDISKNLIKTSADSFPAIVAQCDRGLPFANASFDTVLCSEVIEHILNPDYLLEEIHRVLKPNGLLFLTTPNLASWFNRISLILGYQPHFTEVSLRHNVGKFYSGSAKEGSELAIAGHLRLFVARSLDSLLSIYGFTTVVRTGAGLGYGRKSILPFPASTIDGILSRFYSSTAFLIVVCRNGKLNELG